MWEASTFRRITQSAINRLCVSDHVWIGQAQTCVERLSTVYERPTERGRCCGPWSMPAFQHQKYTETRRESCGFATKSSFLFLYVCMTGIPSNKARFLSPEGCFIGWQLKVVPL